MPPLNLNSKPFISNNTVTVAPKKDTKEDEFENDSEDSYKMDFDDVKEEFWQPFGTGGFGKKFVH